jgi:predicted TIM-barrel fold metal-dependent hydrolase
MPPTIINDRPASLSLPQIEGIGHPTERRAQADGGSWPAGTRLISSDSHWLEHGDVWVSRFPGHLKDKAPRVIENEKGWNIEAGGRLLFPDSVVAATRTVEIVEGMRDVPARLKDLDIEGVEKELLFPQKCLALIREADLECRAWVFRGYNEYIASICAQAPTRLYAAGMMNFWDIGAARESVQHIKALGLKTLMLPIDPGKFEDGRPIHYGSSEMTPFWDAIEEAGLPVCFHIGENVRFDRVQGGLGTLFLSQMGGFRLNWGELVFAGVFDRHPSLKVVFVEGGISWVASALQDADMIYESYPTLMKPKLAMKPSRYWFKHCYATFMSDAAGLQLLNRIGADRVMWSTDYPHNESTFGYTRSAAQAVFDAADNIHDAQMIVGGTALGLFDMH